jgi:hypothetical protein
MEKSTALEKLTGNVTTQASLTALAAIVGSPLAALLPLLAGTLAAGRHSQRVEKALVRFEHILKAHLHKLDALTDPQYKLINEIVLAVLQNTEDEKFEYLRRAMISGLEHSELGHTIAAQVSRALRDMTAGELSFVVAHYGKVIMIGPDSGRIVTDFRNVTEGRDLVIDRNSNDMIYVSGLMGLGVLNPAGSTFDDSGKYIFAKFCETLKAFIDQ